MPEFQVAWLLSQHQVKTVGAEKRVSEKLADKICFRKAVQRWSPSWGPCPLLGAYSAPLMPELL